LGLKSYFSLKKYDWKNLEECHAFHKELVYKAHSEGKQIPDYVLEHYPELNHQPKQQTSNDKQPTANDKQPTKQDYIEAIHGNGAAADGVHPMHDIEVDILDLLDVVTDALDRRGYMQS
jgi:hypothetical protein